jgi:hypothetical protein
MSGAEHIEADTSRILVTEHDPELRPLALRELSASGYQVLPAADGETGWCREIVPEAACALGHTWTYDFIFFAEAEQLRSSTEESTSSTSSASVALGEAPANQPLADADSLHCVGAP